jgi:hypothetical protein
MMANKGLFDAIRAGGPYIYKEKERTKEKENSKCGARM